MDARDDLRVRKKPKREHVGAEAGTAVAVVTSGPVEGESVVELIVEKLIYELRACGGDDKKVTGVMRLYHSITCSTERTSDSVRALQSAVAMGDVRIVRYLIEKGVSLRFSPDRNPGMAPMQARQLGDRSATPCKWS